MPLVFDKYFMTVLADLSPKKKIWYAISVAFCTNNAGDNKELNVIAIGKIKPKV